MVVDFKSLLLSIVLISNLSGNNIKNKDGIINAIENKVKDSYEKLNHQMTLCSNKDPIILDSDSLIAKYKRNDIFTVIQKIFHDNYNNCLHKKDKLYIYNLGMLYVTEKNYDMNTTSTLIKMDDYFFPITRFENNVEYDNTPKELRKYLHDTLGISAFNISKTIKVLIEHYHGLETKKTLNK